MGTQSTSYVDRAAALRATAQHGMIGRDQLLALGFTQRMIHRRLESGRLHRRHSGVYAVGHIPETPESRWAGAVLACRPRAALSHLSAAQAHGLIQAKGGLPCVTIPQARRSRHPGITIHRSDLDPGEITRHKGIPVTTVERTLVDLAATLRGVALRRAFREAQFLRIVDLPALERALQRRPRPALAGLLGDRRPALTAPEDLVLDICERGHIRRPETQRRIGPKRVDFVWRPENVIVEADSWKAHGIPAAYQEDRAVTNELQLMGFHVLRFTWEDLTRRRRHVATMIRRALAARRTEG